MSESKPTQQCPICGAAQPLSSRTCSICGALLPGELTPVAPMPAIEGEQARSERARGPRDSSERARSERARGERLLFDPTLGDDDLFMGDLTARVWRLVLVGGIALALLLGLTLGVVISRYLAGDDENTGGGQVFTENIDQSVMTQTGTPGTLMPTMPPTNTPRTPGITPTITPVPPTPPMLDLPTITPVPPTPTITPTLEPCIQTAWAGATIFEMALKCGHVDWAVVDVILEMNDMEDAAELREGQTLEIPWPTPTPGAEPPEPDAETGTETGADDQAAVVLNEFGTPDRLAQYQDVEATLRPGQKWHTIQAGETIAGIAYLYDTTIELLSQINPEIPFLQCDFGQTYGGPNCSVMLIEGERLRVPVPVPMPEPTATPGMRSPTPQPSPTYNAPYLVGPNDGAHFNADQIVTLRWNGTGTLATNERYVVRVFDMETGEDYVALVQETFYSLPGGWQPTDRKQHTFQWTISVGTVDAEFNVLDEYDETDPRYFSWDSR